jgi:hypothetical protein
VAISAGRRWNRVEAVSRGDSSVGKGKRRGRGNGTGKAAVWCGDGGGRR